MSGVLFVLGILYLCGFQVSKALAICSIIEGILLFISALLERLKEKL